MPAIDVGVKVSGPFFAPGVGGKVITTLHNTTKELVNEGEKAVDAQLYAGHGVLTGHYRRSVHGEMVSTLHGRVHDSMVVYGPWLEGVSSRNQRSRFKGYAMFRNARQKLEKIKLDVLKKWVGRLTEDLN